MTSRLVYASLVLGAVMLVDPHPSAQVNVKGWTVLDGDRRTKAVECAETCPVATRVQSEADHIRVDVVARTAWKARADGPLQVPFDPGPAFAEFNVNARWVTLRVDGGWLVGRDKGEWGGGLWWFPDRGHFQQLVAGNIWVVAEGVQGPYAIGKEPDVDPKTGDDFGAITTWSRKADGGWALARKLRFRGDLVLAQEAGRDGLYFLSTTSLLRWTGDSLQLLLDGLSPLDAHHLDPYSIASDANSVYLGMALLWVQVKKDGSAATWYMPANCQTISPRPPPVLDANLSSVSQTCACAGLIDPPQ